MSTKPIAILGATGSIGTSTLDVVRRFPDRFTVTALAAGRRIERLETQIREFQPELVSVADEADAVSLRERFPGVDVKSGLEGLVAAATHPDVAFVISATVGAVGLVPTLRAIEAGKAVGLANKETLVVAGELMTEAVRRSGATLLPVDSEHNAIHQCLDGRKERFRRIWLTASGGPFRQASREEMERASPKRALEHPTWDMGPKITIDSATLMNKGLEVIEARWLFDAGPERIGVVVHPQSTIHSMVEFEDGSLIAQLGVTDMRLPIQYALTYPERLASGLPPLDLATPMRLDFEPPDLERFPCLGLAHRALELGGTAAAALNAANEVAVAAFLDARIRFLAIPEILAKTLESHEIQPASTLKAVLEADRWAREQAEALVADAEAPMEQTS